MEYLSCTRLPVKRGESLRLLSLPCHRESPGLMENPLKVVWTTPLVTDPALLFGHQPSSGRGEEHAGHGRECHLVLQFCQRPSDESLQGIVAGKNSARIGENYNPSVRTILLRQLIEPQKRPLRWNIPSGNPR